MPSGRFSVRVSLLAGLAFAILPRAAAEEGKVAIEKTEYKGWKNNLRLSNGEVELIVTLDVGPRVIHYGFVGGKNVFKEYDEQLGKSGEDKWQIRGGHRLWVAPEDEKRTYYLDNHSVGHYYKKTVTAGGKESKTLASSVVLVPPEEKAYGLQKEIEVSLAPSGSEVTLIHRIRNISREPTELAPWALTVMAPGGTEIIPLPAKQPHPKALLPNQLLVLWPYFDFKDPRWSFGTKYVTLKQDAKRGPTKAGLAHKVGWVGYLNDGTLFVKHFAHQEGKPYPDHGCNFETFTNQDMLEVETLGPLVKLAHGSQVEHTERWELHKDVPAAADEAAIERNILPKVSKTRTPVQ